MGFYNARERFGIRKAMLDLTSMRSKMIKTTTNPMLIINGSLIKNRRGISNNPTINVTLTTKRACNVIINHLESTGIKDSITLISQSAKIITER